MAARKRFPAVSGRAWSVLEEDCVLGLWTEVRHAAAVSQLGGGGSVDLRSACARQKTRFIN